ncbi:MAG: hypothetical protein ACR2NP_16785 [Pirellulaceae bacterium]
MSCLTRIRKLCLLGMPMALATVLAYPLYAQEQVLPNPGVTRAVQPPAVQPPTTTSPTYAVPSPGATSYATRPPGYGYAGQSQGAASYASWPQGYGWNAQQGNCSGYSQGSLYGAFDIFCLEEFCQFHHSYYMYEPNLTCPGDALYSSLDAQILNGRQAQLVFHTFHFHWHPETHTWELTRSGWNNVYELARIVPVTPGAIRISSIGDPQADAQRLEVARGALASVGLAQAQLFVAAPRGPGLYGVEAEIIYERRLQGSPYVRPPSSINLGRGLSSPSSGSPNSGGSARPGSN